MFRQRHAVGDGSRDSWRNQGATDEPSAASARRAIPVEVWNVETRDFQAQFEVPAVVTAERDVRVAFESAGRITNIYVDEGESVERGQLLARVSTDVDRARIDLLKSQLETAKREFERVKNLSEEGLASDREFDQAEANLESARLNLKQAKVTLDNATITAPIAGEIASKLADEGEFASPGTPLVEIVDASELQLEASVPGGRIDDIEAGMNADVVFPAIDATVTGKIPFLPTRIETRTRTYPVEVQLPTDKLKESGVKLRPGMRANVTIPYRLYSTATVIPRNAVLLGFDKSEVVVLPNPEEDVPRAEIRTVELGPSRGNRVVINKGVKPDETIVIRGHRALTDRAPVEIVNRVDSLEKAEGL